MWFCSHRCGIRSLKSKSRQLSRVRFSWLIGLLLGAYFLVAYLAAPLLWERYEAQHPALADSPRLTRTRRLAHQPIGEAASEHLGLRFP